MKNFFCQKLSLSFNFRSYFSFKRNFKSHLNSFTYHFFCIFYIFDTTNFYLHIIFSSQNHMSCTIIWYTQFWNSTINIFFYNIYYLISLLIKFSFIFKILFILRKIHQIQKSYTTCQIQTLCPMSKSSFIQNNSYRKNNYSQNYIKFFKIFSHFLD